MSGFKPFVAAALTGLLFAGPVVAQQTNTPPAEQQQQLQQQQRQEEQEGTRAQQLLEKIRAVKYQKLRETLSLDDETAKKFFEIYKPAEKDLYELIKQRNAEEQKLVKLTQGDYKDADVDPTITNIKDLTDKIETRYSNLIDQLKPVLNPRQRAKLLVFEHEFNRKVREKVRQWRENHPNRPLPPRLRKRLQESH